MAWITFEDVAPHLRTDLADDDYVDRLIVQAQALAEVEIGDQEEPVSQKLSAVLVQIVVRMWRASQEAAINPAGLSMDILGSATFQSNNSGAGLGLTKAEKESLRKAVGRGGLWVQPITRGRVEMDAVDLP